MEQRQGAETAGVYADDAHQSPAAAATIGPNTGRRFAGRTTRIKYNDRLDALRMTTFSARSPMNSSASLYSEMLFASSRSMAADNLVDSIHQWRVSNSKLLFVAFFVVKPAPYLP